MENYFRCRYYDCCGDMVTYGIAITGGKVTSISEEVSGMGGGGYIESPENHRCRNQVFKDFFKHDPDRFLDMLATIQLTDEENFKYGFSIIIEDLDEQWQRIFLKFKSTLSDPAVLSELLSGKMGHPIKSVEN